MKAALSKNMHIQPSEIDRMPYWEYEPYIEILSNMVKEEKESQEKEMQKYKVHERLSQSDPKRIQSMMRQGQPKAPSMPSFGSTPSWKI